jgi:hypothetical protein
MIKYILRFTSRPQPAHRRKIAIYFNTDSSIHPSHLWFENQLVTNLQTARRTRSSYSIVSDVSIKFTDVGRHFVVEARVREHGSGTRYVLETVLANLGIARSDITIALEFPSNESVRAAVVAGAGATVISRIVVAKLLHCGTPTELKIPILSRSFFLLRHTKYHIARTERDSRN